MKVVGRKRRITDQQAASIMRWHEAIQALKVLHAYLTPGRKLAARLEVSFGALRSVIKTRGVYKQPCPSRKAPKP